MFSTTSRNRKFRKALVGTLTVAALVPAAASAHFESPETGPNAQPAEIPYLSWGVGITRPAPGQGQGGVTPTNLARAVGTSAPTGPLLRNAEVTPLQPATAEAAGSGSRFDTTDLVLGSMIGVALALAAAFALYAVRGQPRTAQS